jgi:hypothetical protein
MKTADRVFGSAGISVDCNTSIITLLTDISGRAFSGAL